MPELGVEEAFDKAISRHSMVRSGDLRGRPNEGGPAGANSAPAKKFKWRPRHDLVVALESSGYTREEICRITKYSYARVSVILTDPRAEAARRKFKSGLVDRLQSIHDKLAVAAHEALDEIIEEMRHCEDVRIRQKASLSILDRAGYTPVQKRLVATTQIAAEDADRLANALAESREGRDVSYIVDEQRNGTTG